MGRASLLIDDGMLRELDREVALNGESSSEVAEAAIGAFLDAKAAKRAAIDAAAREADKGIFVSREAIERWMHSWDTDEELPPPEPDIFPEPR